MRLPCELRVRERFFSRTSTRRELIKECRRRRSVLYCKAHGDERLGVAVVALDGFLKVSLWLSVVETTLPAPSFWIDGAPSRPTIIIAIGPHRTRGPRGPWL